MKSNLKQSLAGVFVFILSVLVGLSALEGMLRFKNASMKNYDIEMWRYANELKIPATDERLGHLHRTNTKATLQSVEIRLNELGLRGDSLTANNSRRTILFLGSSITLGWGVSEEETVSKVLEMKLREAGEDVTVLNAGIGNYNAFRYVTRYFQDLQKVQPTDIVVHYFLRDAEDLEKGRTNWLLKHSELAVTLWNTIQRLKFGKSGETLEAHYEKVYAPASTGMIAMKDSLRKLSEHAKSKGIRIYLAMTPDVHNLKAYPFQKIHGEMRTVANELGFKYVDLLPSLSGMTPEEVWSMPGDPHPNGKAHKKMAEALFPLVRISSVK